MTIMKNAWERITNNTQALCRVSTIRASFSSRLSSERRIIAPSLLRRAMRNWNATYRSIDGNETGADTIEIIINFAGIEPSSWRMKRGRALGTPLEYQLIRFETRFEARREGGEVRGGGGVAIHRFAAMTDRPGLALRPPSFDITDEYKLCLHSKDVLFESLHNCGD